MRDMDLPAGLRRRGRSLYTRTVLFGQIRVFSMADEKKASGGKGAEIFPRKILPFDRQSGINIFIDCCPAFRCC